MLQPDAWPGTPSSTRRITLLNPVVVLITYWRLILGSTGVCGLLVTAYAILTLYLPSASPWNLLPNIYRPDAKIMLLESGGPSPSRLKLTLSEEDSLREYIIRARGGMPLSGAMLAQELLSGNTLLDEVITEFDFVSRYQIDDRVRTRSRAVAQQSLTYEIDLDSAIITVSYEEPDAQFASAVLRRTIELLEERFRDLTMETIVLKKKHLEDRLLIATEERHKAQQELISFHTDNGLIVGQPLEPALIVVDFNNVLLSKEIETRSLRHYLPEGDPAVEQLERETRIMQQAIDELQTGFRYFSAETITQEQFVGVVAEYMNLVRRVRIHEDTYLQLRGQYELVRIEEADPSLRFQVLEPVEVPDGKYWPNRLGICVVAMFLVLGVAILISFMLAYVDRMRADPEEAAKWTAIREQLRWRRPKPSGRQSDGTENHRMDVG